MRPRAVLAAVCLTLLAAGCYGQPAAVTTLPPTSIPVTDLSSLQPVTTAQPAVSARPTSASPTPDARPTPIELTPTSTPTAPPPPTFSPTAFATPSAGCVNGWSMPAPGSPEYEDGLAILSTQMGVPGPWDVEEMRYFTGPEVPLVEPQYPAVERWYVRAALVEDPSFRARFLIERRTELIAGIAAVAPYESTGWESPDWTGFVGEGVPTSYLGLPGQWIGIPFDFVTGAGDSGNPGLPSEVVDCVSSTT